jgi:hypothetical protein
MKDVVAIVTPWSCVDETVLVDGQRLTLKLSAWSARNIDVGSRVGAEGFERFGFLDGVTEFVRKDYIGDSVSRCSFVRLKS